MQAPKTLESKNEYNIGWIAALAIERAAATALLDERHDPPQDFIQNDSDSNSYTWGRISNHNVVIASLPVGGYGLTNATKIALGLISSCPHINIGLLVGIGAGVPESGLDIRLGDVAVSRPYGNSGGVVQYDTGKSKDGIWERTGILVPPREILLIALAKLQAEHELQDSQIPSLLEEAGQLSTKFAQGYKHPGTDHDHLYCSTGHGNNTEEEVLRQPRLDTNPVIHYGTIGSGNTLIKSAAVRQSISESLGQDCICLEMEAAGLMNSFPCLVVRGICDYADAHKNDRWQRYASATAAAFTKELLLYVPASDVARSRKTDKVLGALQSGVDELNDKLLRAELGTRFDRANSLFRLLYRHPHEERKDRNPQRVAGTCEWFTNHTLFKQWLSGAASKTLWVTADPGCGKSVLARYLIDTVLPREDRTISYFFFKDDFDDQKTASDAGCAMLHQLLSSNQDLITDDFLTACEAYGGKLTERFFNLWKMLDRFASVIPGELVCVVDALDECRSEDRFQLLQSISKRSHNSKNKIKVMILSRPYFSIERNFDQAHVNGLVIRLSGENEKEREEISKEIDIVLDRRIDDLCNRKGLGPDDKLFLLQAFTSMPQRTYLWAHLTMAILEDSPGFTRGDARRMVDNIPPTVDAAYEKILQKSMDPLKTRLILQMLLAANRAFTVSEMAILLALDGHQRKYHEVWDWLEPEPRFQITLRDICGLFVVVVDSRVYLLHQTAREFLLSQISAISGSTSSWVRSSLSSGIVAKEYRDDYFDAMEHRNDYAVSTMQRELTFARDNNENDDVVVNFVWKQAFFESECHRTLAQRCLWFINLVSAKRYAPELFQYAVLTWIDHLESSQINPEDTIFTFAAVILDANASVLPSWFAIFWNSQPPQRVRADPTTCRKERNILQLVIRTAGNAFPLVMASILNSKILVNGLLALFPKKWERKDFSQALWWSVCYGNNETAEFLLKKGADANTMASGESVYGKLQRGTLYGIYSYGNAEFPDVSCLELAWLRLYERPLEMVVRQVERTRGEKMATLLRSHGADPAIAGRFDTHLLAAIKWENPDIMQRAYPRAAAKLNLKPKKLACEPVCHHILDVLWAVEGTIGQCDIDLGLHCALEHACLDCTTKALEHGADGLAKIEGKDAIGAVIHHLQLLKSPMYDAILNRSDGMAAHQAVKDLRLDLYWPPLLGRNYIPILGKLEQAIRQKSKLRLKSRNQSPPPMDDDEFIAAIKSGSKRAMKRAGRRQQSPSDTDYRRRGGKSC